MRKCVLVCLLLTAELQSLQAQDHQFTNFLQSPLYLNPALAGTSRGCDRLVLNYRNMYPAIKDAFAYYGVSYDRYVPALNGGLGAMVQRSVEGEGFYTKNAFSLMYAFHGIKTKKLRVSLAVQGGVSSRSIDYSRLIFYDQISRQLGYVPGTPTQADLPVNNNRLFGDFGAGLAVVTKDLLLGLSVSHLSEPDESLISTYSVLPRKYSAHASYNWLLSSVKTNRGNPTLIPSVAYTLQGDDPMLNAGIQYRYFFMNLGTWYRKAQVRNGGDALSVSLMFDANNIYESDARFAIGFSYDYNLNGLQQSSTAGAIELHLIYQSQRCQPRRKKITCPDFF